MVVFEASAFRLGSGVFCVYSFTTVPLEIFTMSPPFERSMVSTTRPPSFSTPGSVSVSKVSVLTTSERSM